MQYRIKRTRCSYGWPLVIFGGLGYRVKSVGKYSVQVSADSDAEDMIREIIKKHRFKLVSVFDESDDRSSNYKKIFYAANPEPPGGYRCIYCNKKLTAENMEIDHIYPVKMARKSKGKYRKKYGLTGVNDPKNLAASCSRCNRKKAGNARLWIWRARLGKHRAYWAAIYALRAAKYTLVAALLIATIYYAFNGQTTSIADMITNHSQDTFWPTQ